MPYVARLTNAGTNKILTAVANGTAVNVTSFKVGDSNGAPYTPTGAETALVNVKYTGSLSSKTVTSSKITFECVVTAESGGYTINEIGIFDNTGTLIAIANLPDEYKPSLAVDGASKVANIKVSVTVSNTEAVTIAVDNASYATNQAVTNLQQNLQSQIYSSVPAGVVLPFAMATPPSGWLKCNGAIVSRTTYAALFAAIGTTYGAGDGSTTFALPDLRGEFVRGFDDSRGIDSGRIIGTAQADELKSHTHTYTLRTDPDGATSQQQPNSGGNSEVTVTASVNATGGSETRPRNIAMLYCIKY